MVAGYRIRNADREQVLRWLLDAMAEGRLTTPDYERRERDVTAAVTYGDLEPAIDGLPNAPGTAPADVLPSMADRQAALADGRPAPTEHAYRTTAAASAGTGHELAALLTDLREPTPPPKPDVVDHIYQRFDHWHRYSRGMPRMALTPRDTAPRPGIADVLLHTRPWQVIMILTWGGYVVWVLAALVHTILGGPHWERLLLPVVLVTPLIALTDFYTYAVVRRTIRRRRLSRSH